MKHGYHVIKDDMASAMGTSGWTHVDVRLVPRSKNTVSKKEASFWELMSPCSSLNHSTSDTKESMQAVQVVLGN